MKIQTIEAMIIDFEEKVDALKAFQIENYFDRDASLILRAKLKVYKTSILQLKEMLKKLKDVES